MEPFFIAAMTSVGVGVVTSAIRTRSIGQKVRWKSQTKAERFHEQKILGRWLITEVTQMLETKNISKEQVSELLNKLTVLSSSAKLSYFSQKRTRETIESASVALHFIEKVDRRYIFLLSKLVEGVVQAVLRTAGEDEGVTQIMKTSKALGGLNLVFRKYAGNEDDITQWKNEAQKKKPRS